MGCLIHGCPVVCLRPSGTVKLYFPVPVELYIIFSDIKHLAKNTFPHNMFVVLVRATPSQLKFTDWFICNFRFFVEKFQGAYLLFPDFPGEHQTHACPGRSLHNYYYTAGV